VAAATQKFRQFDGFGSFAPLPPPFSFPPSAFGTPKTTLLDLRQLAVMYEITGETSKKRHDYFLFEEECSFRQLPASNQAQEPAY